MDILEKLPQDVTTYIVSFLPTPQQSMYHTFVKEILNKDILVAYHLQYIEFLGYDEMGVAVYRIECKDRHHNLYQWTATLIPCQSSGTYMSRFNNNLRKWCDEYRVDNWRMMDEDDVFNYVLIDDWYNTNYYVLLDPVWI